MLQIPKLREWRESRALTQVELAERAGMSSRSVAGYEAGGGARPPTVRKLAEALGVEVADLRGDPEHPLGVAPPSPTQLPLNGFEEERRTQPLGVWKRYLTRRVERCEKVLEKSPEDTFNNPFLSLDTAIQWAICIGMESGDLRNTFGAELRSYADTDSEIVGELRDLLDRFVAVDDTTNVRVKAMMDEARLTEEEKEQRLRVIPGGAA
jgi:transcriptional regulator with XRE-family HTH domain